MSIPKPLKGGQRNRGGEFELDSLRVADDVFLQDIPLSDIINGDFVFDPIDIDSGTIDGVIIGNDVPGPATFTTITTGDPDGSGFDVTWYGITPGDKFQWDASLGKIIVCGDLEVRDTSDLGNIRIENNTISSNNTDGDIIIDPDGTGTITLTGPITSTADTGNITFNSTTGTYSSTSYGDLSLESTFGDFLTEFRNDSESISHNGDMLFMTETGHRLCITNISVGAGTVQITTNTKHHLVVLATITISGSNSTPSIDGTHTVNSIVDDYNFQITGVTTTATGDDGEIRKNIDITNTSITAGSFVTVTTLYNHDLRPNDTVVFSNTNSTPSLDGTHTIVDIPTETTFRIAALTTGTGNDGNVTKNLDNKIIIKSNDIELKADNSITLDSENLFLKNRIVTIGPESNTDDNLDRGILMNYHNGTSSVQAFMGFDDSTGCWTFIPEATNTNGVISGTPGCITVGDITGTNLDLQNGDITNVNNITAISLAGDPDLTLTATNDIFLTATNDVNIPTDVGLTFGGDTNKIEYSSTAPGFCIDSSTNIKLTPSTTYDVVLPSNIGIVLDGNLAGTSTQKIESDGTDITINTGDLNLSATEDINIPSNVGLTFGNDNTKIEFNGTDLCIDSSGGIKLNATTDLKIPCNIGLVFTNDTPDIEHKIESDCTDLNITTTKTTGDSDINLIPKSNVNIPNNIGLTFGDDRRKIISDSTDLILNSDNDINLTPEASNDVNIPQDIGLTFGGDSNKIEYDSADSQLEIDSGGKITSVAETDVSFTSNTGDVSLISTTGDIYLTPSTITKSVILPNQIPIEFGATSTNITSDASNNLILNTSQIAKINANDDIELNAADKVKVPIDIELEFGDPGEFIVGDGTNLTVESSNNLNLNAITTIISGNLQVDGTTTTVNSDTVTIDDPVFTLGGDTPPTIDDNKDRGIEFRYHNGTIDKIGFFGFDDSSGCWTFIPDAVNTNEVFSGAPGCINVGDITGTNLNLQGGDITNANLVDLVSLCGDPDLTLKATSDINLQATNDVNIPSEVGLTFGTDANKIEFDGTNLCIDSSGTIKLNATTNIDLTATDINLNATSSIDIPTNIHLEFGNPNKYIYCDGSDLILVSNNDVGISSVNIELNATDSVDIPSNIPLNMNNDETTYITGGDDLTIVANQDINLTATNDVNIPSQVGLTFGNDTTKIEFDGTDLCIDSSGDIKLTPAGGDINITGNVDITGMITNAEWNGDTIAVPYGGTGKTSWTEGSVIFAGTGGTTLEEDNPNFYWDNTNDRLGIGTTDLDQELTIAKSGHLSFRANFDADTFGMLWQNVNRSYTWRMFKSQGTGSNAHFNIAGGINENNFNNLICRFMITEDGVVGINFQDTSGSITTIATGNPSVVTTSSAHGLETGNIVTIGGSDSTPSLDGTQTITVLSDTTFSVPVNVTNAGTTGTYSILKADRIDSTNDIKLHVNGCIKVAGDGLGSCGLLLGANTSLTVDSTGDLNLTVPTTNTINIPTNVGLTFGADCSFIKYDGTDMCIESCNNIKLSPTSGGDIIIDGNLIVNGSTNIGGSSGGGTAENVDAYLLCLGKGQRLDITNIANGGGGIEITVSSVHNLVLGDTIELLNTNCDPTIDGSYTITAIVSTTTVRIAGSITTGGDSGQLNSKHVTDPGKDVGIKIEWHDGGATGTANAKTGAIFFDRSDLRMKYIPEATIVNDVVTGGALGDLEVDNVYANNIVYRNDFDANTILKADTDNTPVPLTVPEDHIVGRLTGGVITALSIQDIIQNLLCTSERFSVAGAAAQDVDETKSLSYITTTGTGIATGNIADGTYDCQQKTIIMSAMDAGTEYHLTFTGNNFIDPGSGGVGGTGRKAIFNCSGQTIVLTWDNSTMKWYITGGSGADIEIIT